VEISDSLQEIIVSYYEGNLTQSQAEALLDWVRESDENLRYFRQMGEIWQATSGLNQPEVDKNSAIRVIQGRIAERGIRRLPGREIRLRISTLFKAAAAILVIIALGTSGLLIFKKNQSFPMSASFIETSAPKGSRSLITLSDGTTVWLNADTKFRYPVDYGISNRTVYLEGEAYFKVSKNRNLPFRVNTSDITVTALGTAFNVKAYKEEGTIETTLEEGRVRIDAVNAARGAGQLKPVLLKPNQNAVFQKQVGEMAINSANEKPDIAEESSSVEELKAIPIVVSDVTDTRLLPPGRIQDGYSKTKNWVLWYQNWKGDMMSASNLSIRHWKITPLTERCWKNRSNRCWLPYGLPHPSGMRSTPRRSGCLKTKN